MVFPWGSAFDEETVVLQACGPNATWDGSRCVPNAPPSKPAILGPGGQELWVDRFGRAQGIDPGFDPHDLGGGLSDAVFYPGYDDPTSAPLPPWDGSEPEIIDLAGIDFIADLFPDISGGAGPTPDKAPPPAPALLDASGGIPVGSGWAETLAPGTVPGAPPVPAAAGGYVQQGIVSPGISDAEQAWLDAAIEQDAFLGDLVQVPVEQTLSTYDPDAVASGVMVDDPRLQMRIDLAEDLLGQGYTVADIEQFLGMGIRADGSAGSLLTDEELGTVAGTRVDPDFAGVGTDQWFRHLAAQGIEVDPSGKVTKPWTESPEFLEMYSAPSGGAPSGGGGAPPAGGGDGAPPAGGEGGEGGFAPPAGGDPAGEGGTPVPDGIPTYVNEQVDRIDIINNRLKEIGDALTKARDLGLGEIDTIEAELRAAELSIYDSQYGTIDPITGEMMNPGEMDRLLTTYRDRRTKSKKTRAENRANIVAIMAAEGVDAGLAQTELDMIDALHGDAVDTAYNYIDSLWRIGKMSHDERDSMISNMMGSYRLQLRDQVVEMLMAEEITAADQRFVANQEALSADTIADLFPNMTENQVYGLMGAGLGDLLELPGEKEIGMITSGEWAGYTSGQKANALVNAGWTQNADGTFTAPAADADPTGMISAGPWAGYTEADRSAAYLRQGYTFDPATGGWTAPAGADGGLQVPIPLGTLSELGLTAAAARAAGYTLSNIQYDPAQIGRILDATVTAMGSSADFSNIASEQRLGEAAELSYAGLITEGPWAGYTQAQKTVAEAANEDPTGMITEGTWAGVTFGEKARALNAQGIDPETGLARSGDDVEPEDKKYRMESRRLTERGIKIGPGTDFEEFGRSQYGGHVTEPFVMISVQQWADLTGEYMFPAADEADADWMTTLFPSGVKTADVPGLPFDAEGGEYLMDIEALSVFGPLQDAADAARLREESEPKATLSDMLMSSPWPDSDKAEGWITGGLGWVQDAVAQLKDQSVPGDSTVKMGEVLSDEMLWMRAVEQGAATNEWLAQVWAAYTGIPFRMRDNPAGTAGKTVYPDGTVEP